jgi:3'(2'), 5'-bisphosphate nucleotidase
MSEKLTQILQTAYEAGQIILKIYHTDFDISYKEDESPLTKADELANQHIIRFLKTNYPEMSILSEESADDRTRLGREYCWIVDPLDGTKEFIKKNGEFTVNIALTKDGKPILGVVYVPVTDEMYYASKDEGAYKIKHFSDEYQRTHPKRINVSTHTTQLIMMHSRSHRAPIIDAVIEKNKDRIKEIKMAGSSLKGCLIACGEADIYYRFGYTMEWDTAAMQCIVEEAGGLLRQLDDTEMTYNRSDSLNRKGFYILNHAGSKLNI